MNIAVLGKSQINSILERQFTLKGITPLILENVKDIESVRGERGNFVIKNTDRSFEAAYIIVTEEPSSKLDNIAGGMGSVKMISFEDNTDLDNLPYSSIPVVFILDYPVESPAYMTRMALEKAIKLTKKKRKVVYLAKFMRTAGDMLESLYKEARNLGVTFFKYDSICVDYQGDEEVFHITASDASDSLEIFTHTPVFAGEAFYNDAFLKIIKLLKLKLDNGGHVSEDSFFLFPSLTSRKGIYFTNLKTTSGSNSELMSQVEYILSDIRCDLQAASKVDTQDMHEGLTAAINSEEYAEVDSAKCAFCYTCYRACPHFAMVPDYENSVMKNQQAACYGCGICSSVCPANAITMVRKAGSEGKITSGSLKVFCCENSGAIAFEKIAGILKEEGLKVEVTPVSCGGELSAETISSALKDFDRVLVAVCMDDACRHFEGNKRAKRYVERVREMLRASGIDENRALYMQLSHAMPMVLKEYIREMV